MKKIKIIKNLFTTTLFTSVILNQNIIAASKEYDFTYSNVTIPDDPLLYNQIKLLYATDIIFSGSINTNNNLAYSDDYGVRIVQSNVIFNNTITSNNNKLYGINLEFSTAEFNGDIISNNQFGTGVYVPGAPYYSGVFVDRDSIATFNGNISVDNNNYYGVYSGFWSTSYYNGTITATNGKNIGVNVYTYGNGYYASDVTSSYNERTGIDVDTGSYAEFSLNANVTVNNNGFRGIFVGNHSNTIFNGTVTAQDNIIYGVHLQDNSTAAFNNTTSVNGSSDYGFYIEDSTLIFGGDITSFNNGMGDVYLAGANGASSVVFNNNTNISAKIETAVDGTGILTVNNGSKIVKDIGAPNFKLDTVKFVSINPNERASLNADIYSNSLEFGALRVGIDVPLTFSSFTTNETIFALSKSLTIPHTTIITDKSVNKGFSVEGISPLIFTGQNIVNYAIKPVTDMIDGNIVFANDPEISKALGTNVKNFNRIEFSSSNVNERAVIKNDIHAYKTRFNELTIGIDAPVTIPMPVETRDTTIDLNNAPLTLNQTFTNINGGGKVRLLGNNLLKFNFDNVIDAKIVPEGNGSGNIEFTGGPTIEKDLGETGKKFNSVQFTSIDPNAKAILKGNIYAKDISFKNLQVVPVNNNILIGAVLTDNTIFDLGKQVLTIDGSLTHNNPAGGIVINTTFESSGGTNIKAGHFEMVGNSNVDLSTGSTMTINLTESVGTPPPQVGQERRVDLFVTHGGTVSFVSPDQVVIITNLTPNSKHVQWSFDKSDGALVQKLIGSAQDVVQDNIKNVSINTPMPVPVTAEVIKNGINITQNSSKHTDQLFYIYTKEGLEAMLESIALTVPNVEAATGERAVNLTMDGVSRNIAVPTNPVPTTAVPTTPAPAAIMVSERMTEQSKWQLADNSDSQMSGIAAGGEAQSKYGLWVSPFYGQNSLKMRKTLAGYKSKYFGGVVGFDSVISDRITAGAALSTIHTDIKHADYNVGDTTKIDTYLLYIYGAYEINDKWFIQNVTSFGINQTKNRERRREVGKYSIAKADYKNKFVSCEVVTSYNYNIKNNMILTPKIGLDYDFIEGLKYRETGTDLQNLMVKTNNIHQLRSIVGISLSDVYAMDNGMMLVPEVHGDVSYVLYKKKSNVDARFILEPEVKLELKNVKPDKTTYSIGTSIIVKQNLRYEYSIGYDCRLADKFSSHQGTLKVRVNF